MWAPSSGIALDWTTRLIAVPTAVSSLELLLVRRETRPGGLLDWAMTSRPAVTSRLDGALRSSIGRRLLSPRGTSLLNAGQLVAALALLWHPRLALAIGVCLVVQVLMAKRHQQSLEGSDEMIVLLLTVALLRSLSSSTMVQDAAVAFVAGQVCLGYLTAGLSKTQSWEWWTGWGLPRILSTRYFGRPVFARPLWRHRSLALAGSWTVVLWESLFVLALVLPPRAAVAVLAVGLGLHLACAVTMSLSMFVWAYPATYPCFLTANEWVNRHASASQRLEIGLAAAVLVIGTGAFFAGRVSVEPHHRGGSTPSTPPPRQARTVAAAVPELVRR